MKKILFILPFVLQQNLLAQQNENLFHQSIYFGIGYSIHGTGDISGLMIDIDYSKKFKKKLFWSVGFNTSIYDGQIPQNYIVNGQMYDLSIRYTTAGIQTQVKLGIDFIRTPRHELGLSLGALLRYQSSSYYDDLIIYFFPEISPFPLNVFLNRHPQRTYTVGGTTQIFYHYAINKRYFIGFSAGLQTDSNGDTITNLSIKGGIKF